MQFFVGSEQIDGAGDLATLDLAIRRLEEAVVVDLGVDTQRGDQADVRAFWRFDRADSAVVRDVDVANFKAGPLAVETTWSEGRKSTLMHQHREGVRLVDDLRELGSTKEEVDGAGDALGVHQIADATQFVRILHAHPLLDGAAEFQEALAHLFNREFIEGSKTSVAQVVDIVDVSS